ncbi:MAG: TonB-dependent receptor [Bacteroidia bacterium]|nr:TonB-dependent receptor [Bacteroidia bacterium]
MRSKLLLFVGCFFLPAVALAQVQGRVVALGESGEVRPLPQARLHWLETNRGTLTDSLGVFQLLAETPKDQRLVVQAQGFISDTIFLETPLPFLEITLRSEYKLEDQVIVAKGKSSHISSIAAQQTELLTEKELFKAACCNLSESFETNPSVDVSFTDAVTGVRQIELLGLSSKYTLLSQENMPAIRGLASNMGLSLVPGPWVQGIQISKGAGSVVNGFESMTGQINYELKKPWDKEWLYLNGYQNVQGRSELNLDYFRTGTKGWGQGLLAHANMRPRAMDNNGDGFLDQPIGRQGNVVYRLMKADQLGWSGQFNARAVWDEQRSGEDPHLHEGHVGYRVYEADLRTRRLESWGKLGYIFPKKPYQSVGFQASVSDHQIEALFGERNYDGSQQSGYANAIFQSILGSTNHVIKTGTSVQVDHVNEAILDTAFARLEIVPGIFGEYTWENLKRFTIVAGIRADWSSLFGLFVSPRFNARYSFDERTTLRVALGRGQRTASLIAENMGMLATSRQLIFSGNNPLSPAFGFSPEVAWNVGAHLSRTFRLDYREGSINLDAYRTIFTRQVLLDWDQDPQEVNFYQSMGASFANSLQLEVQYELARRLDVKIAYRYTDVRATYLEEGLRQIPLVPQHRALANVAYETKTGWAFDLTANFQGKKRIPDTDENPERYQLLSTSPSFILINSQITKEIGKKWNVYVGAENLTNYRQLRPIIAAEDPFGAYFDAAQVWGPIMGTNVYAGFRMKLENKK